MVCFQHSKQDLGNSTWLEFQVVTKTGQKQPGPVSPYRTSAQLQPELGSLGLEAVCDSWNFTTGLFQTSVKVIDEPLHFLFYPNSFFHLAL